MNFNKSDNYFYYIIIYIL